MYSSKVITTLIESLPVPALLAEVLALQLYVQDPSQYKEPLVETPFKLPDVDLDKA